ncbi:MAG: DUF4340 domain-containing protein [Bacteroidota bacterium]
MNRSTLILVGILAVLIFVAYLVLQKPGEQSSSTSTGEFLAVVDSLAVDRIHLKSPSLDIVLEKQGVEWYLRHPLMVRADQANVAQLIHQTKNLEVKNVVSSNAEKQSMFQVDSTGTQVTLYEGGNETASFILGKTGPTFSETYGRRKNSNEVMLVSNMMNYVFTRSVKEWRDRSIVAIPRETIKQLTYQFGDTTFTLEFKDSLWIAGREPAQGTVVEGILSSLVNFQGDDFIDTPPVTLPRLTATLSFAGVQLAFHYVKETDTYMVRSSLAPQWYTVSSWRANQVLKRKKEIVQVGA